MGMLTQHLVVNFLIFLFVFHQLWTCAFHCPKKSLNIPLLHVLVIILAVFSPANIHSTMVILAAKLILHMNRPSALVRNYLYCVISKHGLLSCKGVWKSCEFSVLLNLGLDSYLKLFNLCRAFRTRCGQQLPTVMVESPPFFISSKSQIPLFDPTLNFSESDLIRDLQFVYQYFLSFKGLPNGQTGKCTSRRQMRWMCSSSTVWTRQYFVLRDF